jgi:hypothetical protein
MLTVDDDEFWKDIQPLDITGLPAMQVWAYVRGCMRVYVCVHARAEMCICVC